MGDPSACIPVPETSVGQPSATRQRFIEGRIEFRTRKRRDMDRRRWKFTAGLTRSDIDCWYTKRSALQQPGAAVSHQDIQSPQQAHERRPVEVADHPEPGFRHRLDDSNSPGIEIRLEENRLPSPGDVLDESPCTFLLDRVSFSSRMKQHRETRFTQFLPARILEWCDPVKTIDCG